jgi:hypothetical protein
VGLDRLLLACRGLVAHHGGETVPDVIANSAVQLVLGTDVLVEECQAQTFTGAIGQGGDGVGAQPEMRCDLVRLAALDVEVPQDQPPSFRQGLEGAAHHLPVEPVELARVERDRSIELVQL